MFYKKNKLVSLAVIFCFLFTIFIPFINLHIAQAEISYDDLALQAVRNQYNLYQDGRAVDGAWNFGAYDAYILNEAGANLDTWVYSGTSFKSSLVNLINTTIDNHDATKTDYLGNEVLVYSSKMVAQEYLAAKNLNEAGKANQLLSILQTRQTASGNGSFDNNAFSDIPAFEALGRAGDIEEINTEEAINYILNSQDATTGAWGWGDFLSTAQAVRSLHYLKPFATNQETIETAINNGLNWMSQQQQEDGSFTVSSEYDGVTYWDDRVTDTVDAIITLDLLEKPLDTWKSDTDKSPVDYMEENALNEDGTFGYGYLSDNTQALEAYLVLGANIAQDTAIGISVTPVSAEIIAEETQQYTATLYKFGGSSTDISIEANWSSSDDNIAEIDGSGLATGYSVGEVDITAAYRGVSYKGTLNVTGTSSQGNNDNNIGQQGTEVFVKVTGRNKEDFFSETVILNSNDEFGVTALEALVKTGLSYEYDSIEYIHTIAGQGPEGKNGWMYKVDNEVPGCPAIDYNVSNGQRIEWFYSLAEMNYDSSTDSLTGERVNDEDIKATLASYNDTLLTLLQPNTSETINITQKVKMEIKNADKQMTQEKADEIKEELADNTVNLNQEVGEEEAVVADSEVSMLIPEKALSETKKLTVDELTTNEEPKQFAVKVVSSTYEFGPSGTKFDKPVTISLKVAITEDTDIESLAPAWYDEESKQWVPIPGVIDLETGLVVFQIDHFTKFAVINLPDRVSFTDVNEDIAWARDAIEILAGQGIINGTGNGFEPQRSITRAEFVKLIVEASGLDVQEYTAGFFSDVNSSDWFADVVACAYENNIITGYPDGTFRPDNSITRNEIAAIFTKLKNEEINLDDTEVIFNDTDSIPAWALNGVMYVFSQGLMQGYEDGTFKGDNSLTRAEAAVTIYRYLSSLSTYTVI